MRFPLSVLLKYSAHAKAELGQEWNVGPTEPRYIDWSIDIPIENIHNVVEVRGIQEVLK